ncbi:MAG: AsmA family protein, partial [Shimia sp.]|nr:AsmA family protein [Shimia sp.]
MRIIRILFAIIFTVILGIIALVMILPGEKIAGIAADQVKSMTGRDLVFEGDVGISWYPTIGISTGKVTFSNAPWSANGPMFSAERATIGVDVMAALGGDIRIKKIELIAPDVLLETNTDGAANWEILPTSEEAVEPTASSSGSIALENMVIRDARLRYMAAGQSPVDISN